MKATRPVEAWTFGKLLRDHRITAGYSQEELAERARMSANGISALERGIRRSPQKETVALLADALALSAQQRHAFEKSARSRLSRVLAYATGSEPEGIRANNLPASTTPFFGREPEVVDIETLLAKHRFVSLVGSGGIGKTRTSLEVAAHLQDAYRHGVWFIELAPVMREEHVAFAIGHALDIDVGNDDVAIANLVRRLADREALIVLDNCEHLIDAASRAVSEIIRGCPQIRILSTSRQPLRVAGERTYRMPSFAFPLDSAITPRDALHYTSVQLFVDRRVPPIIDSC